MSAVPLEWLIVGGGVHGTYLSHVLLRRGGVPRERLRVLDPHAAPLALWNLFTANTGMKYLRSPAVHHLGDHPQGLVRFASRGSGKQLARFVPPYQRPGLALFRAHTDALVAEHALAELRVQGRATRLSCHGRSLRVETADGALEARGVVLAIGASEQPRIPAWVSAAAAAGVRIDHLFDGRFRTAKVGREERVIVVGGGITAVQVALSMAHTSSGRVTLVSRHPLRKHPFDSDPGWLGPRNMGRYARTSDLALRRQMIQEARHRGSVPPEIFIELKRSLELGLLTRHEDEIRSVTADEGGATATATLASGRTVSADRILLATGFEQTRPGGAWLSEAVDALGLACAQCGYPVLTPSLRWSARTGERLPLFVSGPLAELELGPSARNIAGARHAGERLLAA